MIAGVRLRVWALAGLVLIASSSLLVRASRSRVAPPPALRADAGSASRPVVAPSPNGPSLTGARRDRSSGSLTPPDSAPASGPPSVSDARDDPALAVAEEAASRLAARLAVPGFEVIEAQVSLLPPLRDEDAASYVRRQDEYRRRLSADALLEEYLARLDYQNTLYAPDYPLERVREAARSEVRRLRGVARVEILDEALDGVEGLDASPRFAPEGSPLAANDAP